MCGFLNNSGGGRIYIGVRDQDLMVKGVQEVTIKKKDEIKLEIDSIVK